MWVRKKMGMMWVRKNGGGCGWVVVGVWLGRIWVRRMGEDSAGEWNVRKTSLELLSPFV
jgi:hypothetical protein